MRVIVVGMADMQTVRCPDVLTTLGLGSCVGVALFDRINKIGGLAHIMLPTMKGFEGQSVAKFADSAIAELVNRMVREGALRSAIVAKIAGGAHMFGHSMSDILKIGERNSASCIAVLRQLGIPLQANDTGGPYGRTIELNTETGALKIRTIGAGERFI